MKTLKEFLTEAETGTEYKKGSMVVVATFRDNPQLGEYVVLRAGTIKRVGKKTVVIDDGLRELKFDSDTRFLSKDNIYGSSYSKFYSAEEAKTKLTDGDKKFDSVKISGDLPKNVEALIK